MAIRAITLDDDLKCAQQWLAEEENYKWLDIGPSRDVAWAFRLFLQRPNNKMFVYTDETSRAIGIVGLRDINARFKTGELWGVLGDKRYVAQGYTERAAAAVVRVAFDTLQLESLHAWTVESNIGARRLLERAGFRPAGRQRRCHIIDGVYHDRLLYDLTRHDSVLPLGERDERSVKAVLEPARRSET